MIVRNIEAELRRFFQSHEKKALLVTGARQVGKTYIIEALGRQAFSSFVRINFIENKQARSLFEGAEDSDALLLRLSALAEEELIPGQTLIFLDEVQECKEIVTAIKFLVEEGSYRYILSGSLLGVDLRDIRSVPVGYMDVLEMYPLDLAEFAQANGVAPRVLDALRESFETKTPVDPVIHEKMMELFRLYLIVGGLNAKNKRFILKDLHDNFKFDRFRNSFLWLKDAGVALPTYSVKDPVSPLLLTKTANLFKLFLSDVGLLSAMYMDGIQLKILNREQDINFGSVYENAAAQELKAHGFDLYYFNSKKQGEVDFLVERTGQVLPLEIKSGKDYTKHAALNNLLENPAYAIPEAYVFHNGNVNVNGKITYYPIYLMMFLEHPQLPDDLIYAPDFSALQ